MTHLHTVLTKLTKVKDAGQNKWSALCPAHADRKPSLSIALADDGKVLLYCHAGCELKEILTAMNMQESDLFPQTSPLVTAPHIVATYDYTDADGQLLYQVIRRNDKTFAQRRPDGRGRWIWNLKDTQRVLYNLPYLIAAPTEEWVFIVEGEKDVNNLREHNLAATCNSGGAGQWHQVSDLSPLRGRRVAIIPDNDAAGHKHAHDVAVSLHGVAKELKMLELPDMPEKGDVSDWLATFGADDATGPYHGIRRLAEAASAFEPSGASLWAPSASGDDGTHPIATDDWPEPQPIPDDMPPVKPFDPALLPSTLRPWIVDIAERMQCPPDFPAVASMVALSGVLGRRIALRPKQQDNWAVYPNLWGMLIGRPSLMKSPPMKETLLPIRRMAAEALAEYEAELREHVAGAELQGVQSKVIKDKLAKAIKNGDDTDDLEQELKDSLFPQKPQRRRYTVNDVTVEALGEILAANPNGLIVERDELMGFLKSLERPGQEGARAFYLEAWTGDGSFETDRIGRGNVRIDGVCLSILGTIQPGPLGIYLSEALRGGTGDDGLMQRFQLAVWPDDPGPWQVVDRWPDSHAKEMAHQTYQHFDTLPATSIGELPDPFDSQTTPFVRFDAGAQERFYDWMAVRENHLRSGAEHPAVESHLTKYRKLIPALALVIHLAERAEGRVGLSALERAIGWGDYLETHARRIYACGIDPAVGHARALARRIEAGEVADGFTVREVYHGRHWSMLADAQQVQLGVDELIELGWLRAEVVATPGRPKVVHHVNPRLLAGTA